MVKILCTILLTVFHISSVILHPARPNLPLCTEEKGKGREIQLHCIVFSGQFLDFDEIRAFTSSRHESEKFNVSINCFSGGKIRLPWPFFAKNVVSLHVRDCVNEGFLSERSQPQIYPNELQQVLLSNIKNKIEMIELHNAIRNIKNMSKDYDCGHTNASVMILRNMAYVFPPFTGTVSELILMEELMSSITVKELMLHNSDCRYEKLRYLEESGSRSFSAFHMKLMENSQYPRLGVYSLRNNSLASVPPELENMRSSFLPKLSVLDLSDNQITATNFAFSKQSKNKLLINLRRNLIRTIGKNQLNQILNSKGVIFDIRENPLDCSCELFLYGDYLSGMPASTIAYAVYKETTCQYEHDGALQRHFLSDRMLRNVICSV
ncbi:uncharacterized protein LOC128557968 [Mercenaria mercenaria]|uniref:uncharacterized protein LOC128557968 n=1 Tax=Mercenaria mercenaria TaxID=6596 RepID=UPI00234E48D4|nr:uncharacterized protein LOC128557968 [Mercenaria mercenaria]